MVLSSSTYSWQASGACTVATTGKQRSHLFCASCCIPSSERAYTEVSAVSRQTEHLKTSISRPRACVFALSALDTTSTFPGASRSVAAATAAPTRTISLGVLVALESANEIVGHLCVSVITCSGTSPSTGGCHRRRMYADTPCTNRRKLPPIVRKLAAVTRNGCASGKHASNVQESTKCCTGFPPCFTVQNGKRHVACWMSVLRRQHINKFDVCPSKAQMHAWVQG